MTSNGILKSHKVGLLITWNETYTRNQCDLKWLASIFGASCIRPTYKVVPSRVKDPTRDEKKKALVMLLAFLGESYKMASLPPPISSRNSLESLNWFASKGTHDYPNTLYFLKRSYLWRSLPKQSTVAGTLSLLSGIRWINLHSQLWYLQIHRLDHPIRTKT